MNVFVSQMINSKIKPIRRVTKKEIVGKITKIKFPEFDLIIAINRGGIHPAKILSKMLKLNVETIDINYRDDKHVPRYNSPKLMKKLCRKYENKSILLVDDVSRTGKTLRAAKKFLKGNKIKTFVVNGKADYSLYNTECFKFPWLN